MTGASAFGLLLFFVVLNSAASWTLDLSQVKSFYVDRNSGRKNITSNEITKDNDKYSMYDVLKYADDYEYKNYVEEKNDIHEVVSKGSQYLEGLRRAIEEYTQFLDSCNQYNKTGNKARNMTIDKHACDVATNRSDYVRSVAQLAVWAAKELQERTTNYKNKINEAEERTLLLRLAWLLDRLAHLTGYDPDAEQLLSGTTSPVTMTKRPPSKASSDMHLIAQATGKSKIQSRVTAVKTVRKRSIDNPMSLIKLYVNHKMWENSDQNYFKSANNNLVKTEYIISNNDSSEKKRKKRSFIFSNVVHKPGHIASKTQPQNLKVVLEKLLKKKLEFVKHNILPNKGYRIHKRSIDNVEYRPDIGNVQLNYYLRNYERESNFNKRFPPHYSSEEMYTHKPIAFYGRPVQAKLPENPQQDISSLVKIRRGTSIRPDPAQADLVRLALQRIFDTGNIEVIKTYGSNYNPAVPNPLLAGIMETGADV